VTATFRKLLRTLLPRDCPGCGEPLGQACGLCTSCAGSLTVRLESHSMLSNAVTPHLVVLGQHRGLLRRAARELKYSGHRDLAGVLGQALAQGVPAEWTIQAVSAVPMHPDRQRQRHFNHAEVLARSLADALKLPYVEALARRRHTAQQAKQSGSERSGNLEGAFVPLSAALDLGGPLLLVDDVMTTGNTLRACRDALNDHGLDEVYYAVLTR
jgi:ComF family protein